MNTTGGQKMTETALLMLPAAIGIAVSPIPIAATILMLMGKRARSNGILFLLGWMVGLVILSIIVFAVGGPIESGEASNGPDYLRLAIGFLLLALAVRRWFTRAKPGQKVPTPKWMAALEQARGYMAFGLGVALVCINPKEIALAFDGVIDIVRADLVAEQQILLVGLFVLVASASIILPVAYYLLAGESAKRRLLTWKKWLIQRNDVIMMVILLVFGIKLIIEAL